MAKKKKTSIKKKNIDETEGSTTIRNIQFKYVQGIAKEGNNQKGSYSIVISGRPHAVFSHMVSHALLSTCTCVTVNV